MAMMYAAWSRHILVTWMSLRRQALRNSGKLPRRTHPAEGSDANSPAEGVQGVVLPDGAQPSSTKLHYRPSGDLKDLQVMTFTRSGREVSSLKSLSKDVILSTILHVDNRYIIDSVDSLSSEEFVTSISYRQKDLVSPYVNFICPQSGLSALMFATW